MSKTRTGCTSDVTIGAVLVTAARTEDHPVPRSRWSVWRPACGHGLLRPGCPVRDAQGALNGTVLRDVVISGSHLRRGGRNGLACLEHSGPATLTSVRHLLDHWLDLGRLTILVGENGAGKSTIVEAIAMAYGLSREGGSVGAQNATRHTESDLHEALRIERGPGASRWGYFIRAETLYGLFSYLEDNPGRSDLRDHQMSHGESFKSLMATRPFHHGGLFVLDEPEAGLSFVTQLSLVGQLAELALDEMSQVLVATHSPIVAATPAPPCYSSTVWA